MDINEILNEETQHVIDEHIQSLVEEVRTGVSTVPTYPYTKQSEGVYIIRIDDDEKDIHTNFEVTFGQEGNRDEKIYSISFKEEGGSYAGKTGMGIQFRILSTITKIITELVNIYQPNVLTFTPVKEEGKQVNRRLMLYMRYVKAGAGEDFDSFIFGNQVKVNVEKRTPSFPIENGYQEPEMIQDIVTELSLYNGHYETGDVPRNDPNFMIFQMQSFGGMQVRGAENKSTGSARRFVDWMLDEADLKYVQGSREAQPYQVPTQQQPQAAQQPSVSQAPIQRVSRVEPDAGIGSFMHFMQTEIYGMPQYDALEAYYETAKSIEDWSELKDRARQSVMGLGSNDTANRDRLQDIIRAIDMLESGYGVYRDRYGEEVHEVLNEVEDALNDLLK